ncbi:unnamed protein product [Amoebophrya sp. A120]|nr:unnamed protein product [Amoebophrya sp. A120]|eukprot:GSA120T00013171001.1
MQDSKDTIGRSNVYDNAPVMDQAREDDRQARSAEEQEDSFEFYNDVDATFQHVRKGSSSSSSSFARQDTVSYPASQFLGRNKTQFHPGPDAPVYDQPHMGCGTTRRWS